MSQEPSYHGLTLQLTLQSRCKGYTWVNNLRSGLFNEWASPESGSCDGRQPAHITLILDFSVSERDYPTLLDRLDEVASKIGPFALQACGMTNERGWVAIRFVDADPDLDRFAKIATSIRDIILYAKRINREPHITVYRGPSKGAYVTYLNRSKLMGGPAVRKEVKRRIEDYAYRAGGSPLSVKVTGVDLMQDGQIVRSFPFKRRKKYWCSVGM